MKTTVKIVTNQLSAATKEEMWSVYQDYYRYSKQSFMDRIGTNNYYVFYLHRQKLVGFTGLRINRISLNGKTRVMIYFGQAIIQPEFRGKSFWAITGVKVARKFWRDLWKSKVYFWADALSYKAYLVFAKTLLEYYPNREVQTPAITQELIHYLGNKHYPGSFCSLSGTVQKNLNLVKDRSASIPYWGVHDPDIQFYTKANPQHEAGHGLLTIAPVNRKNVAYLVKRYFYKILGLPKPRKNQSPKVKRHDRPTVPTNPVTNSFTG